MSTVTAYRPRHSWGVVRLSTTQAQMRARLAVVDAVGEPAAEYVGRHRTQGSVDLNLSVRVADALAGFAEADAQMRGLR